MNGKAIKNLLNLEGVNAVYAQLINDEQIRIEKVSNDDVNANYIVVEEPQYMFINLDHVIHVKPSTDFDMKNMVF